MATLDIELESVLFPPKVGTRRNHLFDHVAMMGNTERGLFIMFCFERDLAPSGVAVNLWHRHCASESRALLDG